MSSSQVKGNLGLLPTTELYLPVPEPVRGELWCVYTVTYGPKAISSVGSHSE